MSTGKSIMQYIHAMNGVKTENVCYINPNHDIIVKTHPTVHIFPRKYYDLSRGFHKFTFNGDDKNAYVIHNPFQMNTGDHLVFKGPTCAEYYNIEDNITYSIPVYRIISPFINNRDIELPIIDGYPDMMVFSSNKLYFTDSAIDNSQTIILHENPRIFLSYLTCGNENKPYTHTTVTNTMLKNINRYSDLYVVDNIFDKSYIKYRTGAEYITGMEPISKVDTFSTESFTTYFIKNELVLNPLHKEGYNADDWDTYKKLMRCSHFPITDFETLRKAEYERNAICLSADKWRGNGFYIKISNAICPDMESFIRMLVNDMYKTIPLQVLYPLAADYYTETNPINPKIKLTYPMTMLDHNGRHTCSIFFKSPLGALTNKKDLREGE